MWSVLADLTAASGVAAEDELDGVVDRYAYAIATEPEDMFGEIRVLDLETLQSVANSQGQVALATIEGRPVDVEIRRASSTVYAYVTSAVEDSGDCPTGGLGAMTMSSGKEIIPDPGSRGGGPRHRRTILTVFDMDRPSFDNVQQRQSFDLSCVSLPQPADVDDIGLAWNEQRDKLYVVVPDADKVFGISCCGSGGDLIGDPGTWQSIDLPMQRPTDIVVGKFDLGTGPIEMAVVTALGVPDSLLPGEFPGAMRFITGNPVLMQQLFFESGSKPVSLSTHPDAGPNGVVVIADRGQQAIRVVRVNQTGLEEVQRLPTVTIPTRVTVQGRLEKAQPGN